MSRGGRCVVLLIVAGCAARSTSPATPRAPSTAAVASSSSGVAPPILCPSVPLIRRPVHPHPTFDTAQPHCGDPTPDPAAARLPFGRDIDDALYCVDALYDGPEALPLPKMLSSALTALCRAYPDLQASPTTKGAVVLARTQMLSVNAPVTVRGLITALLGIAAFVRDHVSNGTFATAGNPEHVLILGAFEALAWRTSIAPEPGQPMPPTARTPGLSGAPQPAISPLADGIFYVRAGRLASGMAQQLRQELAHAGPVRGLILDLRGSPGGLFTESIGLSDLFLRRGCLAVLRSSEQSESRVAHDQRDDVEAPVVVLIDHDTSSGSEALAETLRAQQRAVLVGERTAGDGIITVIYEVGAGSQLYIPIAELMSGDGVSFQGRGIEPDLPIPDDATLGGDDRGVAYALRLLARSPHGGSRDELLRAR